MVSYNRPFNTCANPNGDEQTFRSWFMYAEYPMIRFLEENGYDVSYTTGEDMSQPGAASIIEQHKVYLTAGHDEYWSGQQRANVTAARNAGVNLAFFSGNEVFWKTRWAPSIDGSNTPNRTLVTYKETHYNAVTDPEDPPTWTGTWMDPRFSPPADGGDPQNSLTGQLFDVNGGTTDITVPYQYSKLRFWRNTRVASLSAGSVDHARCRCRHSRQRVGRRRRQRVPASGADRHVVDDRYQRRGLYRLRQQHPARTAPPPIT